MWLFISVIATSIAQTVDDDRFLLDVVAKQSLDLHMTDTLRVGDSVIVLCDTIWKHYQHPLCLPLLYAPEPIHSLTDTTEHYSIWTIRRNALRYIRANHADLYVGVSDPTRLRKLDLGRTKVHRAEVKESKRDQLSRNRTIRNLNSPWRKQAQLSLQLTQNYATDNWYQGAVNAFSMLGNAKAYANYKGKYISWENSAEWRVGVSTVSGDSLRVMNTTDDRFQIYSKFGYQFHKKWYVSTFADFKTNLFPNYQKNSYKLNTTFLTPIRYTMGVGVDYKPIKGLNINISPATYKMVYSNIIDPAYVDVTSFGLEEGQHLLNEIGSSLRVEWKWKPIREIELETRFYFFTNYKQIEVDLEIDVDFIINRYMSAKLMLHPRYDGTIDEASGQASKLQFKEVISVGFAHTFR